MTLLKPRCAATPRIGSGSTIGGKFKIRERRRDQPPLPSHNWNQKTMIPWSWVKFAVNREVAIARPALQLNPKRLLVRGVNWLGDAVMTTPALQRLRERFPEAHIALLTHEKLKDLWLNHPAIDEVITFTSSEGP